MLKYRPKNLLSPTFFGGSAHPAMGKFYSIWICEGIDTEIFNTCCSQKAFLSYSLIIVFVFLVVGNFASGTLSEQQHKERVLLYEGVIKNFLPRPRKATAAMYTKIERTYASVEASSWSISSLRLWVAYAASTLVSLPAGRKICVPAYAIPNRSSSKHWINRAG